MYPKNTTNNAIKVKCRKCDAEYLVHIEGEIPSCCGYFMQRENPVSMGVLHAFGNSIPEAWEEMVGKVYTQGIDIKTEYDKEGDPQSKDAVGIIEVGSPLSEPRYHRNICMGLDDLYVYIKEVVDGIHNHWIDPNNGKWSYTYNQRLFEYTSDHITKTNQVDHIIKTLKKAPYSRRAQAITYIPGIDYQYSDPPCLQRIWCRVINRALQMNVHMRSNDLYKATLPNIYAFTELQKIIAEEIGVGIGSYVHISDSMHIYGSYMKEVENFFSTVSNRSFKDRTWSSKDPIIEPMFAMGNERIKKEINEGDKS